MIHIYHKSIINHDKSTFAKMLVGRLLIPRTFMVQVHHSFAISPTKRQQEAVPASCRLSGGEASFLVPLYWLVHRIPHNGL